MKCPFTIVVDSREQKPFAFSGLVSDASEGRESITVDCVRAALPSGDYSLEGYESVIAVERKSPEDLFHSLGQERRRFKREIERLSTMRYAAVVVEADWLQTLHSPPPFSLLLPKVVYRTILAWQMEFPTVHWWLCPSRFFAEATTFRILERFWKKHRPEQKHQDACAECFRLRALIESLAARIAAQAELLASAAERRPQSSSLTGVSSHVPA